MVRLMIDPEKIREVIGKGGSVIQKITAETNSKGELTVFAESAGLPQKFFFTEI